MAGFLEGLKNFAGGAKDFLVGSPGRTEQFQRFTPDQQGINSQLLSILPQLLQQVQGGNRGGFAPIAQQARTQFNTQTIPSLAERFTALGGGQNSSAFQGALGQAGSGLEEGLAGLESKFNLAQGGQQQQLLLSLLQAALQPQFENAYFPRQPGFLQGLAGSAGQGLGTLGGLSGLQYLGLL
jgi:hypothetical protein